MTTKMMILMLSGEVTIQHPDGAFVVFNDVIDFVYFNKISSLTIDKLEQLMIERNIKQMFSDLHEIENTGYEGDK